jgi:hypothetical protein
VAAESTARCDIVGTQKNDRNKWWQKKCFTLFARKQKKVFFSVQVLRKQDCIYKILTLNNYE